jgi:rRNA maturation protein Nop10
MRTAGASRHRRLSRALELVMATCPHCGGDTIHPIRKWWSDSAAPTRCPVCGGLSHVSTLATVPIYTTSTVLLILSFGLAALMSTPSILIAGMLVISGTYVLWWRRVPLVPTTAGKVAATRWWGWGFVFLFFALVALAAYW